MRPSPNGTSRLSNVHTRRPWVDSVGRNGEAARTRPKPDLPTPESPTRTTLAFE